MALKNEREDKLYDYDPDVDYQAMIDEAVANEDFSAAAKYEQQRNEKIQEEGLTQYQTTQNYAQYLPQPSYADQMDDILDRIMNREPFKYDMDADALYQQYKDQYMSQGKLAMEDTMGQAAALTGGYGNSYAQTVGQQVYNRYMDGLNDVVPELYAMARNRYDAEGNALMNQYALLADREQSAYARESAEQEQAYALALSMLQSGIMPSQGVLDASGLSMEDAQAIYDKANEKSVRYTDPVPRPDEDSEDIPVDGTLSKDENGVVYAMQYNGRLVYFGEGIPQEAYSQFMNGVHSNQWTYDDIAAFMNQWDGQYTYEQWMAMEEAMNRYWRP